MTDEQIRSEKYNRRNWLHLTGLISGLIGVFAGIAWSFRACSGVWQESLNLESAYIIFSWLLRCVILLVACKWALTGGVLLLLDSSLFVVFFFMERYYILDYHSPASILPLGLFFFTYLPTLVSGVIFLFKWKEGLKIKDNIREIID